MDPINFQGILFSFQKENVQVSAVHLVKRPVMRLCTLIQATMWYIDLFTIDLIS